MNRREFETKVMVIGGGIALGVAGYEDSRHVKEVCIKGELGNFYPLLEYHKNPPTTKDFSNIKNLNIHFAEVVDDQRKFSRFNPISILTTGGSYRDHTLSDELLNYFSNNNIMVCLEGQTLGKDLDIFSSVTEMAEVSISLGVLGGEIIDSIFDKYLGKTSRRVFLKRSAVGLGLLWANGGDITTLINSDVNSGRTLEEITKIISLTHPERLNIFLRNLFMARQLQLCALFASHQYGPEPNISFEVGKDHPGIEFFVAQKQQYIMSAVSAYPTVILNKVMDENGGIETFCKTPIYSPRAILKNETIDKQVVWVRDGLLANTLHSRLNRND